MSSKMPNVIASKCPTKHKHATASVLMHPIAFGKTPNDLNGWCKHKILPTTHTQHNQPAMGKHATCERRANEGHHACVVTSIGSNAVITGHYRVDPVSAQAPEKAARYAQWPSVPVFHMWIINQMLQCYRGQLPRVLECPSSTYSRQKPGF